MTFPLDLSDISLWLAITAIILLITSELLHSSEYSSRIMIQKKPLRIAAIGCGISFLLTVVLMRLISP